MKNYFLVLALLPLNVLAFDGAEPSAYRKMNIDYSVYERRALEQETDEKILGTTPLRSARLYNEELLPKAIGWKSVGVMQKRFEQIRDDRFLTLSSEPDFPRRISWLYPKDGCFTRASLFNRNAFRMFVPIPNKVFAFGNLRVKTNNSSRGVVGWWYHVAPIVQVGAVKYVLDPSIEPTKPLTLKEWLGRMGKPEKIKVSICGSGTYSPGDNCSKETDGMELRAERVQKHYLALEKKELQRMGRDVEAELGETPPWESAR